MLSSTPKSTLVVFYILYQIIMSFMGIITNMITITTMGQPCFKKLPTSFFLIILAFSDSLLIFPRMVPIINHALQKDIRATSRIACNFYYLINRATMDVSNWMVVIISAERLLSVIFPQKSKQYVTHKKLKMISLILVVYAITVPFIFIILLGPKDVIVLNSASKYTCVPLPNPEKNHGKLLSYFAYGVGLPTVCITICTLLTVGKLVHVQRKASTSQVNETSTNLISNVNKMLIGICAMFIITNCTYGVYWIIATTKYQPDYVESWNNTTYLLVSMLYTVNYTCNFWVYTLSAKTFRREAMKTIVQYDICPCIRSQRLIYPDSRLSHVT